ncbi:MAG: folate-binding protein [Pontimonas sp.]|nr:folate-binding protein [Pontimonas sp.]
MTGEHFGDILGEMRALARGDAFVDVSDREIVQVLGPDRLVWLNSLISQLVLDLAPGVTKESLILDPHGHIEHAFLIQDDGECTWLLTAPGRGVGLFTWLESMKFRMQVTLAHEPGAWFIAAASNQVLGDEAPRVGFVDPWPTVGEGSIGYAPEPHPGVDFTMTYSVYVRATAPSLQGASKAGTLALTGLEIAAGRPSLSEVDEKTLPHECDWLRTAVHLNKGCYRGQETVAKVHNLGHPPRRLVLLHLDGSESLIPVAGERVMVGERDIGVITRAAWHYELGPIALALVKRSIDSTGELEVASGNTRIPASQEVLVPVDAGATRAVPRLPRLGSRS